MGKLPVVTATNGNQDQNVKNGHGPRPPPGTNPLSQGIPIDDFLKHFRISDLFAAPPPPPGPARAGRSKRGARVRIRGLPLE